MEGAAMPPMPTREEFMAAVPQHMEGAAMPPVPTREEFMAAVPQQMPTVNELHQDLASKRSLPLIERKHLFLMLCRQWHPDKNSGNETHATELFQKLQEDKIWFLSKTRG